MVVNYLRQAEAADQVVQQITQNGGEAISVQGSVAEPEDRRRLIEAPLGRWNRLDVLVNNAGITSPGRMDLLELTSESWDQVLTTNLKGPFFLAQQAAQAMLSLQQQDRLSTGYLVNISSISSYAVSSNRADYCIAKAGMQMMTWLFADRLAEEGGPRVRNLPWRDRE